MYFFQKGPLCRGLKSARLKIGGVCFSSAVYFCLGVFN